MDFLFIIWYYMDEAGIFQAFPASYERFKKRTNGRSMRNGAPKLPLARQKLQEYLVYFKKI